METKQQTQATTIENLRLETGWKFTALLIKETECIIVKLDIVMSLLGKVIKAKFLNSNFLKKVTTSHCYETYLL